MQEEFKDIKVAQTKVKQLRHQIKDAKRNFHCVKETTEVVVDNLSGGAHIYNSASAKCPAFNSDRLCERQDCKNYEWAKTYIALVKELSDARKVRNDLLVKYFWVFKKYRQLKEYMKLNDLAKLKNREYLHHVCETVYLDDADDDVKQKKQQEVSMAAKAYETAVFQRDIARARFWGRKK